jgi:hypothetical protein
VAISRPSWPLALQWEHHFREEGPRRASRTGTATRWNEGAAAEKTRRENDVHLRQLVKKIRSYVPLLLLFLGLFYCLFGRFVTRGVQKHEKNFPPKKSICHLSSLQKNVGFLPLLRFILSRFLGVS